MTFIDLDTSEKLDELFKRSKTAPVILFKHSTACPISGSAYHEMGRIDAEINLLIIQSSRPLSNEIAERTNIRHESPQVIILKDGNPVFNASHYEIRSEIIESYIPK